MPYLCRTYQFTQCASDTIQKSAFIKCLSMSTKDESIDGGGGGGGAGAARIKNALLYLK